MDKIVGLVGSLRAGSYSASLIRNVSTAAPEGLSVSLLDGIGDIPLYNQDEETQGLPDSVTPMSEAIRSTDGLLIATPEYNYRVPGVLKMH